MKKFLVFFFVSLSFYSYSQKHLSVDSVFGYICQLNILHPEIVIKQAVLETGNFKSSFLMSRNNLFGFRKVNYLRFKNWKESVEYYKKWQLKNYKDPNEDYYNFLVRIKYATKEYPFHLKKIKVTRKCS